ncbi:MAG: hypothetical protein ACLFQV_05625 [Vulcanimicrobiota bacterium]
MINPEKARLEIINLVMTIPDKYLPGIKETLEELAEVKFDPFTRRLLLAPYDNEPITPEEAEAVKEARKDIKSGDVYALDEIKAEFGL